MTDKEAEGEALLPCPWDGERGRISTYYANDRTGGIYDGDRRPGADVTCVYCGASRTVLGLAGEPLDTVRDRAIADWNRRATGWIACSERMPEIGDMCLWSCDRKQPPLTPWVFSDGYSGCLPNPYVTHWQLFPKGPAAK